MQVIAIDFDETASLHPHKVNELYEKPFTYIVIYTARSSSMREVTEKELAVLGIKYHSLVMEKLRANIYIDDRNAGGLQWPEC